jgi:hypothetical protein
MVDRTAKFVLVPPQLMWLVYTMAGFSCFAVLAFNLKAWPPALPQMLVSVLVLAVGWWKALFWNPVMEVQVDSSTVTLVLRRGPSLQVTRANLTSMSEYRFGGAVKNTGIRFQLRDGTVYETWALDEPTRRRVEECIADHLQLTVRDQTEGFRSWTV